MIRCSDVEGQNVWITQNPDCQNSVQPTSETPAIFPAAGGNGHLLVHPSTPGCRWKASSQVDWMFTAGINDWAGDGETFFGVRPNDTGTERTGNILLGDAVWQVTQR